MSTGPLEPLLKAVLLIAHGSREEIANREVIEMAERLGRRLPRMLVIPCFLDVVQPDIPAGFQRAVDLGARQILAVPFFLATGVHVGQDIPRILEECLAQCPGAEVRITPAIGPDPGLDEIVLNRIGGME